MKVDTFACDNCGKNRDSDSNHWFVMSQYDQRGFWVMPWDDYLSATKDGVVHLCGQECLVAMLTRYLATGSFTRKPVGVRTEATGEVER